MKEHPLERKGCLGQAERQPCLRIPEKAPSVLLKDMLSLFIYVDVCVSVLIPSLILVCNLCGSQTALSEVPEWENL